MRRPPHPAGFAIIAVVWAVALLALMALDVVAAARREGATALDQLARAQLEAAADAGIMLAIHALLGGAGAADGFGFAGTGVRLAIEPEAAKIDLNQASPRLLRALFEAAGLRGPDAASMAAAIEDWRDTDQITRPGGAELGFYQAAGLIPPRDGTFESVAELIHVRGMTPELLAVVGPAVTVHAQAPNPDRAGASALVQAAVAGAGGLGLAPIERPTAGARADPGSTGRAFTIQAEAAIEGGRFARRAVVRLTGNPREPVYIHEWR